MQQQTGEIRVLMRRTGQGIFENNHWESFITKDLTIMIENEQKFRELVEKWRKETYTTSNPTVLISHPAYQEIIKMGKPVIPLILRELEQRPSMWFTALKAITGEDPLLREFKGDTRKMREAWLKWGQEKGYKW